MSVLRKIAYRLRQVGQQLGFVDSLLPTDHALVERLLGPVSSTARDLFYTMSLADQQHSVRVCRGLQARKCDDLEMLQAALLHDVGKAQGRVPFWTRPVIVLGKLYAPRLLARLALPPESVAFSRLPVWRRALSYAWWHASVGATLCARAGLSEQAVLYVRTHHNAHGPAHELHLVDDES